jgi:P-type E1-E2 ATPase
MLEIDIPDWRTLRLQHLILDLNGTLTLDGEILPGVKERLVKLSNVLEVELLSADTLGRLDDIAARLGIAGRRLERGHPEAPQKSQIVSALDARRVVAIGNGANDVEMLRQAALGIAVIGQEGTAVGCVEAADVLAPSIQVALDLLLIPLRLVATLRR